MKIRIKGNTLRLRLTKPEVAQLTTEGKVQESTPFPGNKVLKYSLLTASSSTSTASFITNEICVFVGEEWAKDWSENEIVGTEFTVETENSVLHVLIEKDFNCLTPRAGENEEDHFKNPLTSHQEC